MSFFQVSRLRKSGYTEVYFHSPLFLRVFNKEILSVIHNMNIATIIKILTHNRRLEYSSVLGYESMSVGK
jgi:hypothetical protein